MTKINTEYCKQKLETLFPNSKNNEWKRIKKYKNNDGHWVRDFFNKKTNETCSLIEINDELTIYTPTNEFSFSMYKYSPTDDFYNIYFIMNSNQSDSDEISEEPVRALVDSIFKNLEIIELESPNYSCAESLATNVYQKLISNGLIYIQDDLEKNSFNPTTTLTNLKTNKTIGGFYELLILLEKFHNNQFNDTLKDKTNEIISHMSLQNLQKFSLMQKQQLFKVNENNFVIEQINKEISDRHLNPHKLRNIIEEDTLSSLRKKLGL